MMVILFVASTEATLNIGIRTALFSNQIDSAENVYFYCLVQDCIYTDDLCTSASSTSLMTRRNYFRIY